MQIRKFTQQGHTEYKKLYREIFESVTGHTKNIEKGFTNDLKKQIKEMQSRTDHSVEIEGSNNIEKKTFKTSYDLGDYVNKILNNLDHNIVAEDAALWDWLALFFFDEIFSSKMKGYSEHRYIYNNDWKLKFRHLIRGPWWCVNYYEKNSKLLLCEEPYTYINWAEQFIKNREIREFKTVMEICYLMYFDQKKQKYIPGTHRDKAGCLFRLRDKLNQYFCVYDLWFMSAKEIMNLLPKEFSTFIPRNLR
jgi:hypothetical protein|tara:strand:- start:250 stop:996 length:747 start_codon:yes stop_codon:yes gene_type:complete